MSTESQVGHEPTTIPSGAGPTVVAKPESSSDHRSGTRRVVAGLAALVVLLAVALGAFALGRSTVPVPATPEGLAPDSVTSMLAARVAAVNAGDVAAIASFYTADAVLEERDQTPAFITKTNVGIANHLRDYQMLGFRLEQTGTATVLGPFVSEPLLWSGPAGGMVTYELDSAGKIVHQWVTGASLPAPSAS
jgi:hypothetical protein